MRCAICFRSVSCLRRFVATGALVFLMAGGCVSAAEPLPGGDLSSVRHWLLDHNLDLQVLQAEAEAADARVLPAGALPDPTGSIELDDIDREHPSLLPANVGVTTYRLRQRVPLWGKRDLSRHAASDQADAAHWLRDAQARELLAQADAAYVRYWYARESLRTLDRIDTVLEQITEVARVSYSLGQAPQQDALSAQLERAGLQRERITRLVEQHHISAELNTLLGRAADAPLAEPHAPPVIALGEMTLEQALQAIKDGHHPALQASQAMMSAANRNTALELRNRYPDISVSLGTMQRGHRLDGYELMLEVDIPFQQRARRERERESRLLESASQTRRDATRLMLENRMGIAWANWHGAREQRELIENTLLTQALATYESALASYRTGNVDFGTLLDALRGWQRTGLDHLDAMRDELLGAAAVRAIVGETP